MDEKKPFHNPFAGLKDKLGNLPRGPEKPQVSERLPEPAKGPARAVVRLERKGRRGKEVTVVEQLGLPAPALRPYRREWQKTLEERGKVARAALEAFRKEQRQKERGTNKRRAVAKGA